MAEVDDTIDVATYPNVNLLYTLERDNKMCYTVLTSKGHDGDQFKIHSPRVVNSKTLATTKPKNFERVKVVADASLNVPCD